MKQIIVTVILILNIFCKQISAQVMDTLSFQLGLIPVSFIKNVVDDTTSFIYVINLHENESTSVQAFQSSIYSAKSRFLYLHQYGKRNIAICFDGVDTFYFDPNRIFTTSGIIKTLATNSHYTDTAASQAKRVADSILQWLHPAKCIIALHNNSNENYSLLSYKRKGGSENDALRTYMNPQMDTDDFIFTNNEDLYKWLKKNKVNAVLQNNSGVSDDGSLSVYHKNTGVLYINIEAEHGHIVQQRNLITLIFGYLIESHFLH